MMNIWDLERITDADVATTLEERFMGSEALYVRFLKKLLVDDNYGQLKKHCFAVMPKALS